MRTCYRIPKAAFPQLDGEGAFRYGGRWNHPGHRMVYTAASISLAVLEALVHFDLDLAPPSCVLLRISIPDDVDIETHDASTLPAGWDAKPTGSVSQDFGTSWIQSRRTAVLEVPSVIVPEESNLLLNPLHPEFPKIQLARPEPFSFDERFFE